MPETVLADTAAPTETEAQRTRLLGGRIPLARLRDLALVPAIVVIAIVGQIVNPVFLQTDNLINVLQTMSEMALLVLAQAMILIVKKMDLSLESTMGLAPGVAAWLVVPTGAGHGLGLLPGAWSIPVTLAVGALVGVINALLIIRFGLNGFIVTLGMLIVLRGVLTGISGGQTFFQLPESMLYLGTAEWFGMPASIWICLVLFAVAIVVLGWTSFGRSLYAIGGNVDAAKAAASVPTGCCGSSSSPAACSPRSPDCCSPDGWPRSPRPRATATSSPSSPPPSSAGSASTAARAPCSERSAASCSSS